MWAIQLGMEDKLCMKISCHKHRFKHLNFNYIYRICYKNAKKGKPNKTDLPYLKTISQIFYQLQNSRYIDTMQGFVDSFGTIR